MRSEGCAVKRLHLSHNRSINVPTFISVDLHNEIDAHMCCGILQCAVCMCGAGTMQAQTSIDCAPWAKSKHSTTTRCGMCHWSLSHLFSRIQTHTCLPVSIVENRPVWVGSAPVCQYSDYHCLCVDAEVDADDAGGDRFLDPPNTICIKNRAGNITIRSSIPAKQGMTPQAESFLKYCGTNYISDDRSCPFKSVDAVLLLWVESLMNEMSDLQDLQT